jgi:hypothetical protein
MIERKFGHTGFFYWSLSEDRIPRQNRITNPPKAYIRTFNNKPAVIIFL